MRYCIPDELFNRIPYPELTAEMKEVSLDGILREIYYKLPGVDPIEVKRETWHSLCDFCARLGVMLLRAQSESSTVILNMGSNKFLRVVGARAGGVPTVDFTLGVQTTEAGDNVMVASFNGDVTASLYEVVFSVRPAFDYEPVQNNDVSREWSPKVPQYIIDRYGESIAHGALARLYAMRGDGGMARMHAVAYNNDLNRFSFGLITSGMRKHLLIDIEDWLVNTNGNG